HKERCFTWNTYNELIKVKEGSGKTYIRSVVNGESIWVNEIDPNEKFKGTYQVDRNGDYSWIPKGSASTFLFKADGATIETDTKGKTVERNIDGKPILTTYKNGGLSWRKLEYDGNEVAKVTFKYSKDSRPGEVVRTKSADGKYSDVWTSTYFDDIQRTSKSRVHHKRLTVKPDGEIDWLDATR
ncbi:MAG: hypothetical protein K2Z81_02020, partial [Cyanobacteria bacterium]|nr:hypothetical protein [Cyanobacteriota bacterium]